MAVSKTMRNIPLDEEDKDLFGSYVNRSLYDVYRKNVEAFTQMWQEQGTSYWLKFCITLRSVIQKEGHPGMLVYSLILPSFSEEFFIRLTKLLIGPNVDAVHEMIRYVISISRYPQVMDALSHTRLAVEELILRHPNLYNPTEGSVATTKLLCQHPLHLRAVGCLLKLLQRWLTAEPLTTNDRLVWKPPQNWYLKKGSQKDLFEAFLESQLGSSLSFLLDIQTSKIAWWNEPLVFPKPIASRGHYDRLLEFINHEGFRRNMLLEKLLEVPYYHILTSMPRGTPSARKGELLIAFMINASRGFSFVDGLEAFHPYSQTFISSYHSAFGPNFWYGEDGIEKRFRVSLNHNGITKGLLEALKHILNHMVLAKMATSVNSHFYDTLHDGTTWTSVVTLIRLPWNMPLCINWMEVLLIGIYEFNRYLKPLQHFPLKEELQDIAQKLFYVTDEAAFLAKGVIILAEHIQQNQDRQASMCYSLRKLLPDLINKLANVMLFLENDAYRILNVILKNGWNAEERETGKNHSNTSSRMLISLSALPDVGQYFAKTFRSIYFWLGNAIPDIENGGKYAVKVAKLIKTFKSGSSKGNKKQSDHDFAAFTRFMQGMKDIPGVAPQSLVFDLLIEEGWISKAEVPHYNFCNIYAIAHLLPTQEFNNFSAAYLTAVYFLGEFRDRNISGQNALARLQRAECLALLNDSGWKLSSMVQKRTGTQPVPTPRFFKNAFREIQNRCADDTDLRVEDATKLLQAVDEKCRSLSTPVEGPLTDVSVPTEVELMDPAVRLRWLECFEKKRVRLLQLVSEEQFKITAASEQNKNVVTRRCFPLNDVLEFRLVEEAAALRKSLEMDLQPIFVHNLVKLLACRLNWLQNAFLIWKKENNSWKPGYRAQQFTREQMKKFSSKNFIDIVASKLRLTPIFTCLISEYQTTHPVCEVTMMHMWLNAVLLCDVLPNVEVGPCYWDHCDSLSKASAYCEQMLLHCKEVWNVSLFKCEPQMEVHFGSSAHAEWIVTVFLKFSLLFHMEATLNMRERCKPKVLHQALGKSLNKSMGLLTVLIAYPQKHPENIAELKTALKQLWSHLINLKKHVKITENIMELVGDKHTKWIELLKLFCSNKPNNVLATIAFSEFISASESEWDRMIKQKTQMEKEAKVSETVHQECQVTAKEEKTVVISDDKSKCQMHKEQQVTINEEKVNKKDTSVLQESEVAVREENLIAISNENDKPLLHHDTSTVKEQNVMISSGMDEQHSETKSNDLDGKGASASLQENITVEDNKDYSANKKKVQVNKGSSSVCKVCTFCKKVEENQGTFKKCLLCGTEKWENKRFFCSEECEGKDAIEMHRAYHKPE